MAYEDQYELLDVVEPVVEKLMAQHQERRQVWYFHEVVPWEKGRSFVDEPWDESHATVSPEVRTALVLNLLTEDNLPYYHAEIATRVPDDSAYTRWNNLWTAEEGQHAIALRSYLLTSRNADPQELEDDRMATMQAGFQAAHDDPATVFIYTAAQELATRVSHRNAGKIADDEIAYNVMARIAADENHHFMFYRGVTQAMIDEDPSMLMEPIYRVLSNFQMPGVGIPGFLRRAVDIAKTGVYNLRIHNDKVITPLLREWKIESLTGLTSEAQEYQEKILALPERLSRRAAAFEARYGTA